LKLRIRGDSIRLRLSRSEVEQLAKSGAVSESIRFGPASELEYAVVASADVSGPRASFAGCRITVALPQKSIAEWRASNEVSLRAEQALASEGKLSILVEKDFPCLVPRAGEDDSDAFPRTGDAVACSSDPCASDPCSPD